MGTECQQTTYSNVGGCSYLQQFCKPLFLPILVASSFLLGMIPILYQMASKYTRTILSLFQDLRAKKLHENQI